MKILTCGDSWSRGEWDCNDQGHGVTHNGINDYFQNSGYQIHNIHRFSNKQSISELKKYLLTESPDVILYFFTDPFRDLVDLKNPSRFIDFEYLAKDINSFVNLHQKLLNKSLKELDKIGKKIYILGGCQRLTKQKYKNIEILIESISELVCPEYTHPLYWDSGWSSFLKFESVNFNRKFFDLVEANHKLQWSMETDEFAEMFRPDGLHPNRHAHYKLYDFLKKNLNELK